MADGNPFNTYRQFAGRLRHHPLPQKLSGLTRAALRGRGDR